MQAYAEGFELPVGGPPNPDQGQVPRRQGGVPPSWLLDPAARAPAEEPGLRRVAACEVGEATRETAVSHAVPRNEFGGTAVHNPGQREDL